MPNIRISSPNLNVKSSNLTSNIHSAKLVVNSSVRNITVQARTNLASAVTVIEGQSSGGVSFGGKGYLIGMMALTYTTAQVTGTNTTIQVTYVGPKPNIRIQNV